MRRFPVDTNTQKCRPVSNCNYYKQYLSILPTFQTDTTNNLPHIANHYLIASRGYLVNPLKDFAIELELQSLLSQRPCLPTIVGSSLQSTRFRSNDQVVARKQETPMLVRSGPPSAFSTRHGNLAKLRSNSSRGLGHLWCEGWRGRLTTRIRGV